MPQQGPSTNRTPNVSLISKRLLPDPREANDGEPDYPAPAVLTELSENSFAQWRNHPVTRLVFDQFMRDDCESKLRLLLHLWLTQAAAMQDEKALRGEMLAMLRFRDISLPEIRAFYGLPERDTEPSNGA